MSDSVKELRNDLANLPPPIDQPAVLMDSVSVDYSASEPGEFTRVLDEVSLRVMPGEFVVLVGRSGCGKTTMLNVLAGLVPATGGTVSVLGRSPRAARDEVGYMFARDALLPWRTAIRNVEYGLEVRGLPRAERRSRARQYLEMVHLQDAGDLWPWQLSQGMRQRVALARTWALEPQLLLMDEPFASLDAQTRASVQIEFIRLWEEHRRSVVFVTHDLDEAIGLGDRVVLVGAGGIIDDVAVPFARPRHLSELHDDPEFIAFRHDLRGRL